MKIEVPRSAWKVALSNALGLGIAERASERHGEDHEASIHRKFDSGLRQKRPLCAARPAARGVEGTKKEVATPSRLPRTPPSRREHEEEVSPEKSRPRPSDHGHRLEAHARGGRSDAAQTSPPSPPVAKGAGAAPSPSPPGEDGGADPSRASPSPTAMPPPYPGRQGRTRTDDAGPVPAPSPPPPGRGTGPRRRRTRRKRGRGNGAGGRRRGPSRGAGKDERESGGRGRRPRLVPPVVPGMAGEAAVDAGRGPEDDWTRDGRPAGGGGGDGGAGRAGATSPSADVLLRITRVTDAAINKSEMGTGEDFGSATKRVVIQKLCSRSRGRRSREATGAEAEAAQFLPCGAVTLAGRADNRERKPSKGGRAN
ncbi:hypothetical protein THAOC_25590 [Thalassiosira oceanica]|uniref:Uncharacterized protein n=1 Tax=Thalassiosira oceanica TaxID=159749 RepID=K0RNY7_THAOC|nr:hypothetical protein THAOC_25590 [Thalassiosira oceanica]|eukprot:EJK54755.1 hypothetical protein THAOC_25590 [Thalassiosira oceanica]